MDTFFFDFDSTLYPGETLDEILALESANRPDAAEIKAKIDAITKDGMDGKFDLKTTITERLRLVALQKSTVARYIAEAKQIEPAVIDLVKRLTNKGHQVEILSNGFLDWILPLSEVLGIDSAKITANRLIYNEQGQVSGIEPHIIHSPLGKWKWIAHKKELGQTQGRIYMVGDSFADYQAKAPLGADYFIAWRLYVRRERIENLADFYVDRIEDWPLLDAPP